jgi:peroxiredoxin
MKNILFLLLASVAFLHAQVEPGKAAPDFTLPNGNGQQTSLSDFKGKTVVLEWTNFGCPFVKKHYGSGNMQKLQADAASKGVVWISLCSSAPGKQGYLPVADVTKACTEAGSKAASYLVDEDGQVGRLYGAKTTPDMFVINSSGIVVYHGAIDDKKSPNPADVESAKNYVSAAISETLAEQIVKEPLTQPYGCSIKYANP